MVSKIILFQMNAKSKKHKNQRINSIFNVNS